MCYRGNQLRRWLFRYKNRSCSMLGECYGRLCPNNRLVAPSRRKEFVKTVCAEVRQLWDNVSPGVPHIRIIFLGSGSLLQELILLAHLYSTMKIESAEVIGYDREYACQNNDEKLLLEARFNQAQEVITRLFPDVITTWSLQEEGRIDSFEGSRPTLLCGADISSEIIQQAINILNVTKTALIVVLGSDGNIRVINSQKR
jgi:hypothetical protein